jgi:biopolymer transport protein ExbD
MPLKLHHDEQPTLNLTAMLDIMFLLLIFFVLNTRFLDDERQINLQVPQVNGQNKLAAAEQQKTINVYRDGSIRLDGAAVTLRDLTARLAAAQRQTKHLGVLVRGDGHGELQQVADVLTACKQAGVNDLAVSVRLTESRK